MANQNTQDKSQHFTLWIYAILSISIALIPVIAFNLFNTTGSDQANNLPGFGIILLIMVGLFLLNILALVSGVFWLTNHTKHFSKNVRTLMWVLLFAPLGTSVLINIVGSAISPYVILSVDIVAAISLIVSIVSPIAILYTVLHYPRPVQK